MSNLETLQLLKEDGRELFQTGELTLLNLYLLKEDVRELKVQSLKLKVQSLKFEV